MSLSRRGFLKILGGATVAAVIAPKIVLPETTVVTPTKAPLFVPSQNLDMGVPRRILTATELPPATTTLTWKNQFLGAGELAATVPMLLLQDNFIRQYGGKLRAGSEVMVDPSTADRWIQNGVAAPGPNAPQYLQLRSVQRIMERKAARKRREYEAMTPSFWDRSAVQILDRRMNLDLRA